MLDAPCSRVGHIFRHAPKGRPSVKGDFLSKVRGKSVLSKPAAAQVECIFVYCLPLVFGFTAEVELSD